MSETPCHTLKNLPSLRDERHGMRTSAATLQQVADLPAVLPSAIERAQSVVHLGKNRVNFQWIKEHLYGENAAINGVHGPAYMLRHPDQYAHKPQRVICVPLPQSVKSSAIEIY